MPLLSLVYYYCYYDNLEHRANILCFLNRVSFLFRFVKIQIEIFKKNNNEFDTAKLAQWGFGVLGFWGFWV